MRAPRVVSGAKAFSYRRVVAGAAVVITSLLAWLALPAPLSRAASRFEVAHDTTRGRITVENDVLKLEFGYKTESETNNNQSGGNLYSYIDKRFSDRNIVSVWDGGSSQTKAYASGAGGIGSTQIYAAPTIGSVGGASYRYALADNARDGRLSGPPQISRLADGTIRLIFDVVVGNKDWSPSYDWYSVRKEWDIAPSGVVALRHNWRILKTGYFSEPASRHQISTMFTQVGRWGHDWSDSVAGPRELTAGRIRRTAGTRGCRGRPRSRSATPRTGGADRRTPFTRTTTASMAGSTSSSGSARTTAASGSKVWVSTGSATSVRRVRRILRQRDLPPQPHLDR